MKSGMINPLDSGVSLETDKASIMGESEPILIALTLVEHFVRSAEKSGQFAAIVKIDLRAVASLRLKLEKNPTDPDAVKWVRQLAHSWSARLAGADPAGAESSLRTA